MTTTGTTYTSRNEALAAIATAIEAGDARAADYDVEAILDATHTTDVASGTYAYTQTADTDEFWEAVAAHARTTPADWAAAIDASLAASTPGEVISHGYADGVLAGVDLDPAHEAADDERGVVVGIDPTDGARRWIVQIQDGGTRVL